MKSIIYGSVASKPLNAFARSLRCGFTDVSESYTTVRFGDYDLILVDGMRPPMPKIKLYADRTKKLFLTTDLGYINRKNYWQVGPMLNWLPPYIDRARFDKLDIELKPYHKGEVIIIAGQKADDASHGLSHSELNIVYRSWASRIQSQTEMPVLFRPHPKEPDVFVDGLEVDRMGISESLQRAHLVVALNSTFLVDAIIAGVPIMCSNTAQSAPLATSQYQSVQAAVPPTESQRINHLSRVAYAQWTLDEIESGECLKTLRGKLL